MSSAAVLVTLAIRVSTPNAEAALATAIVSAAGPTLLLALAAEERIFRQTLLANDDAVALVVAIANKRPFSVTIAARFFGGMSGV